MELITAALQGNQQALGELAQRIQPRLERVVDRYLDDQVRRREGVSDVVQLVHVKVLQNLGQFRGQTEEEFHKWVDEIARHETVNARRRAFADVRQLSREQTDTGDYLPAANSTPSERIMQIEEDERLDAAIRQLPPRYQQILHLRVERRLRWAEIAERVGCSEAAARKAFERILARLREQRSQES